MKPKNGIVHIWNFPGEIYLELNIEFLEKIKRRINEKYQNKTNFSRTKNLSLNRVSRLLKGLKQSVKFIFKVTAILGFSLEEVENEVKCVTTRGNQAKPIMNPNLPFDFRTKSGVTIISSILHDGGITSRLNPIYTVNERITIPTLSNLLKRDDETIREVVSKLEKEKKLEIVEKGTGSLPNVYRLIDDSYD